MEWVTAHRIKRMLREEPMVTIPLSVICPFQDNHVLNPSTRFPTRIGYFETYYQY